MRHFTLRDIFWLTLLVAVGLGWWLDSRAQRARAEHWRVEAIKTMSWVDRNCGWVDVGLTEENEILILRPLSPTEAGEFD